VSMGKVSSYQEQQHSLAVADNTDVDLNSILDLAMQL